MGTENNQQPVRTYTTDYKNILSAVFEKTKAFGGAFSPVQMLDGIQENDTAFSVKTNDTPVVIGTYDTDPNVGFGTGTSNSSRFGNLTEIKYQNTSVPYSFNISIHEGLDRHTVNNDFEYAIAERFRLHSEAQTRAANMRNGAFLSACAGHTVNLADYASAPNGSIPAMFAAMSKYYVDKEVIAPVTAYVTPDLYNDIIDLSSNNTSKGSSVSIDENGQSRYKGFRLAETPSQYFADGEIAYFSPDGVAIPFIGIETARTIETEDFDGVKLQAAAKGGQFMLDDNKLAVSKVTNQPTAALSGLAIGTLTLSPAFNPLVTEYAANTSNATNTVTATAAEGAAIAVSVGGTSITNGAAATWVNGDNIVTITVTNGAATKTYTITVTKS
ncbi:hypothetical protein AGMMS49975_22640 [Clostridia bacterium]|nr:hypothetical protein AGMMS49975_22640 [Clostridia bacterium]